MPLNPPTRNRRKRRVEQTRNRAEAYQPPEKTQAREYEDSNEPQRSFDLDDDNDNLLFLQGLGMPLS